MPALIECIPNFSEGRRPEVVAAIRDAIAAVDGVRVLDVSADASHNRSVITFVGAPDIMVQAAFAGIRTAAQHIDLTAHDGCHPRLGATDVVPFVPLDGATMDDCVRLARTLGQRVGEELRIPVFLYEHAATRPARRNLADVRRGGFERLRDLVGREEGYEPDFGPPTLHPTCGGVAIGARTLLVAFNVHLGPAANLPVAREVARAVRESSGGLPAVKALALEADGQAQVSMNLVDVDRTPVHVAFERVRDEAAARGVAVTWSELVGLMPERALQRAGAEALRLRDFHPGMVLETRLRETAASAAAITGTGTGAALPVGSRAWLDALAAPTPTPGIGSAAAASGAMAAAVVSSIAGIGIRRRDRAGDARPTEESAGGAGQPLGHSGPAAPSLTDIATRAAGIHDELTGLAETDAHAYEALLRARRLPHDTDTERAARRQALTEALTRASEVPARVAELCTELAGLARRLLRQAPAHLAADAAGAAAIADGARAAAEAVVTVNQGGER